MHTLLLSSVLTKEVYDEILATTPYIIIPVKSPYVNMFCIDNNRLPLSPEEQAIMPDIYLFQFQQTIKSSTTIQPTGIFTYFIELRINYNKSMGCSGYYALPIESTKTFLYELLIALVCEYIPALQPIPMEYSSFCISLPSANSTIRNKQDQTHLSKASIMPPLNLKLRRIDFAYDIITDYKNILLDLIGKGYRPKYFKDKAKVYYGKNANNETITESNYLKSKSVYLNVYDKENELSHQNATLSQVDIEQLPFLLRFEVQAHKNKLQYMVTKERKNNTLFQRNLFSFLDNKLEYNTLKYYMESLIGTGHYFHYKIALDIINNSNYTPYLKKKLCAVIQYVSKYHGVYKFLELIETGVIKDMGTLSTVKNYLKQLHALGVNPVTLSDTQKKAMANIKKEHPLPDMLNYKYGEDFIYNPLLNLQLIYLSAEQIKYEL